MHPTDPNRRRPSRLRALSTLLALALSATGAHAAAGPAGLPAPGPSDAAAADTASKEAAAAFKAKRWAAAKEAGLRAWQAGGGADALETIAVAALQLGQVSLAHQCYQAIVDDPAAGAGVAGRARKQAAALAGQGGAVRVESEPAGARIEIGGGALGPTPLTARAMPGKIEVVATFEDGSKQTRTADVKRGAEVVVRFDGPKPAAAVVPAASPAVVPVVVPAVVPAPPVPEPPPPPPVLASAPPAPEPPIAAAPPAPPSKTPEPPVDDAAAGPVPTNPVLAGMHHLALRLGSGLRQTNTAGLNRVAVMPFEALKGAGAGAEKVESIGAVSAELLSARMAAQPRILQVERRRIADVVGEIQRVEGGQVSPDGAVSVGKLLGANAVILGSVGDAGADYLLTARAVDVETGRILVAADATVPQAGLVALSEDMVEVKTPLGAALRSAAVPGWGQVYNGDVARGITYMALFAGFAGTAIVSAVLGSQAEDEYHENKASTVEARDEGNAHYERANIGLIGLGAVWAVSVVDAWLTGEDARIIHAPPGSEGGASAVFRF